MVVTATSTLCWVKGHVSEDEVQCQGFSGAPGRFSRMGRLN